MVVREFDEDEWVENEWLDDDDANSSADLLICPSCRQPVHEDTQQCPHCGDWITPAYPGEQVKWFVWIITVVLLIIALGLLTVL